MFEIPYIHEATFILSRYEEIDIWFVPLPDEDYGRGTQGWRVLELTGTTFTSNIAAQLLIMPILLVSGIVVYHFIWKIAPIPSSQYPYVQTWWPIHATNEALWKTSLRDGNSQMLQAIRGDYVAAGFLIHPCFIRAVVGGEDAEYVVLRDRGWNRRRPGYDDTPTSRRGNWSILYD